MWIESELLDRLKKQADENNISLGDLCRQKLRGDIRLDRLEILIKRFEDFLIVSQQRGRSHSFTDDNIYKLKSSNNFKNYIK